ncbi:hypothetical protein ABVT39_016675 [Epinephelus coioides]
MCRGFQDHMLPIHSATAERKIPPLLKPLCDGPPLLCGGHSHELLHEAIPNSCDYSWNYQGNSGDPNAEAVRNGPEGVTSGQDIQEPDNDWDAAADYGEDVDGVLVVPEFHCPLNEQQLSEVQMLIEQNVDTDTGNLYLLCRQYVYAALSGV